MGSRRACGSHQGAWNLTKAFFSPLTSASKLAGVSSTAEATENRATSAAKTAFIVESVGLWAEQHAEPVRKRGVGCGGAERLGGWPSGWAAGGSLMARLCVVGRVGVRGEGLCT